MLFLKIKQQTQKILVVEDHDVLLELLGKGLTLRGWDTILAGSGMRNVSLNFVQY
jgi:DNA-binding response OmpR family regulator